MYSPVGIPTQIPTAALPTPMRPILSFKWIPTQTRSPLAPLRASMHDPTGNVHCA
ncbi:hypothetical protein BCR44DRAFT_34374 [Catenaria anguillulae PL171]|uniref:Uncharacterized protein n=1 Tax=Catenaria anguillulae PL171 TaxID=765915 RepID=A0A1Y2HMH9_9FUNG|nr:hypothetical protein BCR44DRAFT_34374 [Catenaria anguillulae PL171]